MEKIEKGHPLSQSPDMIQENLARLKQLFPTIVKEGKIDVTELQALLGEELETGEEYYRFTWAGKSMARQEANKPSTGTLRPDKAASKNWDTTGNLFIEGDNLEVLKLLQKSYAGKVKMIYIDPPYNTGKDFVYKDNYKDNLGNYLEITGQTDEQGRKLSTNTESDGRYHSNWLSMMYPRLKLAKNLLKEDGILFASIDDKENENLGKLLNEIFGEENFVSKFIWAGGRKNDSKLVSNSHEYILCYVKSRQFLIESKSEWRIRKKGLDDIYKEYERLLSLYKDDLAAIESGLKAWFKSLANDVPAKRHSHYSSVDKRGVYFPADISWPGGGGPKYEVLHPSTNRPVKIPSRGWMFASPERMAEVIAEDRVHFGVDENGVPCIKSYLKDKEFEVPYSVFYVDGRASTKRLRQLLGGDYFDHPKDEIVLKELVEFSTWNDSIILDFFAGSGTTAHAVMELNAEDGGNRKFICVQLPEPTEPDTEAYKAGYKVISDITKERIRRAGAKIEAEWQAKQAAAQKANGLFASTSSSTSASTSASSSASTSASTSTLDTGFRAFKLDTSNIVAWDGSIENFEQNLLSAAENIKPDRSQEDVLFEILLKAGLDLTVPIEEKKIAGKPVYNIGAGALFVCLANELSTAVAEGVGQWKQQLAPATCRVIFRDTGFTDVVKTNSIQILRRYGVEEVHTI